MARMHPKTGQKNAVCITRIQKKLFMKNTENTDYLATA